MDLHGSGKSTTALGLSYQLKLMGYKVECISEWIKEKVFAGDFSVTKDPIYIFAKQRRKQLILKDKNLDYIISDSPLLLPAYYAEKYNLSNPLLLSLIFQEFNDFDNLNFFLKRTNTFDPCGRFETEEQSDIDHDNMLTFLNKNNVNYTYIDSTDKTSEILKNLKIKEN